MARKDIISAFALSPEKAAKQDLKIARHKELEARDKVKYNIGSTNRIIDVTDAERLHLSDDQIKALMTKSAQKKFEELSKPL